MTADLRAEEAELLLDFLGTAPEPLRGWAERQAAAVRDATVEVEPAASPAIAVQAVPSDLSPIEPDEFDEFDGPDDEVHRRPRIHTPMDKEHTPVAPRERRNRPLAALLAVALVGTLIYGVFRLGQPATSAEPVPGASVAASEPGDAARMVELEAKLATSPNDVATNLELGVLRFNNGDVDGAAELWNKATELDPRNPQAWFNLGFVALAEDPPDVVAARAAWDQVLEVAPESDLAETVRSHLDALEAAGGPSASGNEG